LGSRAASRIDCIRDAGRRDKAAQPAIVVGNEGKRLNRQHFGRLLRIWRPLWHGCYLRFRKNRRFDIESNACGGIPQSNS
jgi:hypothetical protein